MEPPRRWIHRSHICQGTGASVRISHLVLKHFRNRSEDLFGCPLRARECPISRRPAKMAADKQDRPDHCDIAVGCWSRRRVLCSVKHISRPTINNRILDRWIYDWDRPDNSTTTALPQVFKGRISCNVKLFKYKRTCKQSSSYSQICVPHYAVTV